MLEWRASISVPTVWRIISEFGLTRKVLQHLVASASVPFDVFVCLVRSPPLPGNGWHTLDRISIRRRLDGTSRAAYLRDIPGTWLRTSGLSIAIERQTHDK